MIKNFSIYGERHSGTNFLQSIFIKHLPITWDYGWKHWFGWENNKIKTEGDATLFLCIVRDPYDWIMAMHKMKHHIPIENHDISKFLTNEWYSVIRQTNEIMEDRNFFTNQRYKNIFDLRQNKLNYLYYMMPTIATNYEFIKYEDLCNNLIGIVENICNRYNIKYNDNINVKPKTPYNVPQEIKELIDNNIDWDIENQVGYKKR